MATSTYRPPQLLFAGLTIPPAASINAAAGQLRTISSAADRTVIPLVYGEVRQPGAVLNILISAADPGAMLVQVLWGHALDGIHDVLLNGEALPAGATVTHYTGAQTTPDAALVAAFGAQSITYTDTLAGLAYSVVKLPVVDFTGQLTITARLRGRRVYDPRKDSTAPGGSGAHRLADPATWEWSDCPSLCLADWTASSAYGAGEAVDWASVPAAANANDALIGTPAERRRVLGISIQSAALVADMAEALRAYAGCWLVPTAAGIRLLPDADSAPVASYSHAAGNIADIAPLQLPDRAAAPTVVEVVYTDSSAGEPREASAEASLPGVGTTLPYRRSTVKLLGIQRHSQANREAIERLNKLSLEGVATTLEVFDEGLRHERGDIIEVTHPIGLAAATMRVVAVDMAGPGRWLLDLMRHDPLSYSTAVVVAGTIADPARRINPGPASDVAGAAATVSAGLIRVTWAPCPDTGYDSTEVRTTNADWGSYVVAPLYRAKATEFPYLVTAAGEYTFYLRHISNANPSANTAAVVLTVTPEDLPTGGAAMLRLSPATAVVQADAAGNVASWVPAQSVATVTAADGSDDTAGWTYSIDSTVNLTATLSGTLGNILSVTGFSAGVDPLHRNVLIQVHGYPTAADTSQYARAPRSVHAGVSFIDGPTPVGAGFVRLPAGTAWHDSRHLVDFGGYDAGTQDPTLVDASGQPWDLQAFVRVNVQGTAEATLVGSSARRISVVSDGAGVRLRAVWNRRAANAFGSAGDTATALVGASVIALGTWVHARVSYCSDGVLRFWVGGVLQASASIGAGWRDAFHPDTPYSTRFTLGTFFFSTTALGPEADLCEVRHLAGVSGPLGGNFTPPSAPFVDAAAPASGAVVVRAAKAGQADLTARLDVSVLRAPLPVVTATATPATLTLAADWQGNVTAPSVASVVAVSVNGVGETSAWGMAVDPDQVSGLFGTLAAPAVTATAMNVSRSSGEVRAWLSRPGYPAQRVVIPVAKTFAAQSVVVAGGPANMAVQADWADTTPSNLPLSATVTAMNGATNQAGLYTWTPTASAGITASNTGGGPTVTLTAMASGTLTGTITMTGTRSNWPTLTWTIAVTKTLDPQPVVVPGGPPSITVAGAVDGTVPPASVPVSATVTAMRGITNDAAAYTWTPAASAGITASNTAGSPTVQITAMATDTDSGTVTMTGVRSGWPSLSWTISVFKSRTLPAPGVVVSMAPAIVYEKGSSSLDASVRFTTDGLIQTYQESTGVWSTVGNWYFPQTAGIGSTHDVRLLVTVSSASGLTGTSMSWVSLATDYTFTAAAFGAGTTAYFNGQAQVRRSSPSITAPLGTAAVNLISEQT